MNTAATGFLALVLLTKQADGSVGDRHHVYLDCIRVCITKYGCPQKASESGWIFTDCFK